jgi:hypothetical protein
MSIYKTIIYNSTPEELTVLIKDMAAETEKYRNAFYAAKTFIDSHEADPDLTPEMCKTYELYQLAIRGC